MSLTDNIITALENTKPEEINTLKSYLPYRNTGEPYNYDIIAGHVLGILIGKKLAPKFNMENFKADCLDEVGCLLSEETFLEHIRKMYFEKNTLPKAAPEFLLLRQQDNKQNANQYLCTIFQSFMANYSIKSKIESKPNFLETIFLQKLIGSLEKQERTSNYIPYLPFIAQNFVKDLSFISHRTEYFLQYCEQFLELYNFLYCSQLALNIRDWQQGEPSSKPLYFILDTEKASQERTDIQKYGFQSTYKSVTAVFPILSMLDKLNKENEVKLPLWKVAEEIKKLDIEASNNLMTTIHVFAEKFHENRGLTHRYGPPKDAIEALQQLFKYAEAQFDVTSRSFKDVKRKYQTGFEKHIARHFVQVRGRTGRVLVLSQDYLLLLTNLVIGNERKIHFQKLLEGFRNRGVYFDKQSEQSLIAFFDRVGNVDRLSDSGDAVYVRSTI